MNISNEIETIIWFSSHCKNLGYEIISAQSCAFPDAEIKDSAGKIYKTEFEYFSSSFIEHEHNPSLCDLIICWINDFPIETDFPIWELSTNTYPKSFEKKIVDILSIQLYISNFMGKRLKRRLDKKNTPNLSNSKENLPSDWRKVRPTLNQEQVYFLATSAPKIIVRELEKSGISITPRTAVNWRNNSRKELGMDNMTKEILQ